MVVKKTVSMFLMAILTVFLATGCGGSGDDDDDDDAVGGTGDPAAGGQVNPLSLAVELLPKPGADGDAASLRLAKPATT